MGQRRRGRGTRHVRGGHRAARGLLHVQGWVGWVGRMGRVDRQQGCLGTRRRHACCSSARALQACPPAPSYHPHRSAQSARTTRRTAGWAPPLTVSSSRWRWKRIRAAPRLWAACRLARRRTWQRGAGRWRARGAAFSRSSARSTRGSRGAQRRRSTPPGTTCRRWAPALLACACRKGLGPAGPAALGACPACVRRWPPWRANSSTLAPATCLPCLPVHAGPGPDVHF